MQSLLDVLNKSAEFLQRKNVANSRLDAELLLAHYLECERLDLYLQYDRLLTESQLAELRPLVRRRSRREPLQYIIGEVDFLDLRIRVDNRALIPRSETEELVTLAIDQIQNPPDRILDLGTGSGVIAMVLANAFCQAEVTAVDSSMEAIQLASENLRLSGLNDRITLVQSDWFASVKGNYDMIVSNPPYLSLDEWDTSQPEIRGFEPVGALVSKDGGLYDAQLILERAPEFLRGESLIVMEHGLGQYSVLAAMAEKRGYHSIESAQDISGRDRFLVARY